MWKALFFLLVNQNYIGTTETGFLAQLTKQLYLEIIAKNKAVLKMASETNAVHELTQNLAF